jgi:hypothetical protein
MVLTKGDRESHYSNLWSQMPQMNGNAKILGVLRLVLLLDAELTKLRTPLFQLQAHVTALLQVVHLCVKIPKNNSL